MDSIHFYQNLDSKEKFTIPKDKVRRNQGRREESGSGRSVEATCSLPAARQPARALPHLPALAPASVSASAGEHDAP